MNCSRLICTITATPQSARGFSATLASVVGVAESSHGRWYGKRSRIT